MIAKPRVAQDDQPARAGQDRGAHASTGPRGRGAMRDVPLNIDPRIDLTKPIYEQVLALEKADAGAAGCSSRR